MFNQFLKQQWRWFIPIVLFLLFTPWSSILDIEVAKLFYNPEGIGDSRFINNRFTDLFFDFGSWAGWGLFWISLAILFFVPKWRKAASVPVLVMLIGPGLIVHAGLKENWGRPRPRQIVEFKGKQEFRPYYKPYFGNEEPSKSFSCGHCSMGFYFFALAILGEKLRRRGLMYTGYFLALLFGISLSILRIAQGGHFLSDTIVSALVLWLTSLFVGWLIYDKGWGKCLDSA